MLGGRHDVAGLYPIVSQSLETGNVITLSGRLWPMLAGMAAGAGQQWTAAEDHFETALRQAHTLPHRIAQPEVRRWYAWMLLDRNQPGDAEKARTSSTRRSRCMARSACRNMSSWQGGCSVRGESETATPSRGNSEVLSGRLALALQQVRRRGTDGQSFQCLNATRLICPPFAHELRSTSQYQTARTRRECRLFQGTIWTGRYQTARAGLVHADSPLPHHSSGEARFQGLSWPEIDKKLTNYSERGFRAPPAHCIRPSPEVKPPVQTDPQRPDSRQIFWRVGGARQVVARQ